MGPANFRLFTASAIVAMVLAGLVVPSAAQVTGRNSMGFGTAIHGVPPSVTSFNFGGQPGFHGVPASVTSLGFGSQGFHLNQPFCANCPFGFRHRRNFGFSSPFFGEIVAVPYAYPIYVMEPGGDDSMEEDYRGGPTVFDRRGSGQDYRRQPRDEEDYRRSSDVEPARQQSATEQPGVAEPIKAQPPTVLVYKDGHQTEVLNYAIVGETLYELNDGRTKKIALAELDLSATEQQNDERGVDFRVPVAMKSN